MARYSWSVRISRESLSNCLCTLAMYEVSKKFICCHSPLWNKDKCVVNFFLKIRHFLLLIIHFSLENNVLFPSRHPIKIQSFLVYHGFCVEVLFLSFFEETTLIEKSHLKERLEIFGGKFFLRPVLLVFEIMFPLFI